MSLLSTLALAALAAVAQAQSLNVVNKCTETVFLYTQTSFGTINNNVFVAAGASANLGISSNWDGAVNVGESLVVRQHLGTILLTLVGTGCNSAGSCTTGGPTWDGVTPFSRAEFNFVGFRLERVYFNSSTLLRQYAIPGSVTYDISLIYGYNVGMKISSADASCDAFACTISSGCVSTLCL